MKKAFFAAMVGASFLIAGQAQADEALAKAKLCTTCHKIDAKLVGPAYKDVAKKYKASDIPMLTKKVLDGGSGVWGGVPMAPNKNPPYNVTEEEAKKLVTWILSLK
ncbi:MAG: c-type cytochrome [Zoogloeaceae bacterium]|jgi:cytochrome c|nr:c-type cytochrome [Zoogloeaceae bacterium]